MKRFSISLGLAALAAVLHGIVLFSPQASAKALIKSQPPCAGGGGGSCITFTGGGVIPQTIRSITFIAPSAGQAAVSVTAAMFCANNDTGTTSKVVDFVTQIVPAQAAVPSIGGPSALRQAVRIPPPLAPAPGGNNFSQNFNLASTRVFAIPAAGRKHYYFNLAVLRLDSLVQCTVYDAALTVIFIP